MNSRRPTAAPIAALAAELADLRGRVDVLEAKVRELEARPGHGQGPR